MVEQPNDRLRREKLRVPRSGSRGPVLDAPDFQVKLLAEVAETNRLLRRIDTGISALLRSSGDPYGDAFGDSQKTDAEERAWLERRFGTAFDRLTESEAALLAERLPPERREAFERGGKCAVKYPLMRLMVRDQAERPR